ncbi:elongator complex protein 1 [Nymphaea colorata]|nr:elongator complex protein 1 [Nymphaea colorata]XP_031485330.1 elongator complex protein 1 [Nymphaea colorata]XP_031485331.1 elongator complex protein 1 [Nymphaea colorata]
MPLCLRAAVPSLKVSLPLSRVPALRRPPFPVMKNLKLYAEYGAKIDLPYDGERLSLSAADAELNRLFFATSANAIYVLHLSSSQENSSTEFWVSDVPLSPTLEPDDYIMALDYLMEKEALIIGTLGGFLLQHSLDGDLTEVVGRVEGGVKSIAASPDGSLLAVATGLGQLIVMNQDWDVLYEVMLEPPASGSEMNVHWEGSCVSKVQVSWRGDGKFFATLVSAGGSSSLSRIRIWDRETGASLSSSEYKVFMGGSLDWMPSGAKLVAAYDRATEQKCPLIVGFERNGLERGSFSIDDAVEATVDMLKWNCNSELLASLSRCKEYDSLKVWHFSNNHWYLKHESRHSKTDYVSFCWDPVKPLNLIAWMQDGKFRSKNFAWVTAVTEKSIALVIDNCSILVSPLSMSLIPPPFSLFSLKFQSAVQDIAVLSQHSKNRLAVALSDGCLSIVELPLMDSWENLEGKEFIIESCHSDYSFVGIGHLTWLNHQVVIAIGLCESGVDDACHEKFSRNNGFSCEDKMRQACSYLFMEVQFICSEDSVADTVTSSGWHAKVSKRICLQKPVLGVVKNPTEDGSAFVQFVGGSVVEYTLKSGLRMPSLDVGQKNPNIFTGFTSSCPWMKAAQVRDDGILKPLIFGMDEHGRLHARNIIVCNNCSSFSFYSSSTGLSEQVFTHIILTTKQDFLHIISLGDILHKNHEVGCEKYIVNDGKISNQESRDALKVWERGAKLIGVIHGDEAAVILQTTRGNLECIYPRKLVLTSIANALIEGRFKDSMLMVRRNRIDYNIVVDYCGWQAFLQVAPEFVKQIKNLSHITDFVCSIKNENVMETMYKNFVTLPLIGKEGTGMHVVRVEHSDMKNKVSAVLSSVRRALEEYVPESPARELCILTTLARNEPPALGEALKRIKRIRELELSGTVNKNDPADSKSSPSAEEALKHLLWLSDSEAVYETSLGLYDLNLAAIVALNSQKDPKEFLPFLQKLEQMPPIVMRYTVDLKLRRFESALLNMASAGEDCFEDSLILMKKNPQLFSLGLQLYSDCSRRSQVFEAWGDHLFGEESFTDAASAYLCCSSLEKALKAYRSCNNWKGVLTVAGLLNLSKEKLLQLAHELCEELQALGKPAEAAKIALEYCHDVHSGIMYFISAREWEEALRVGFLHGREALISEVKNAAAECASVLISEYEEGVEKVGKYLARYLAVRQRRLALAAKLQSDERSVNDDDDDASETSSTFSGMSAYTLGKGKGSAASISSSSTSRTKERRRQRNRGRIRAGSPGEEIALVDHLKGMALTSVAAHELKTLLGALLMLGKEETARKLQRMVSSFQLSQRAAVKLAEDCLSNETMDTNALSLDNYIDKLKKELPDYQDPSWQSIILHPPLQR